MGALDTRRQRRLAGLARGVRAAVVVPSLFALALLVIEQPQAAGFAVFGTFAHLVMVDYDRSAGARFAEAAMLTVLGALMVSLGALASAYAWLTVIGAFAVGCLAEAPLPPPRRRLAVIRAALLLSFMLAVAVPVPARSVLPYLAGWLLAGIVAQPALLLIWVPLATVPVTRDIDSPHDGGSPNLSGLTHRPAWIGEALGAGSALGFAVLLTRLFKVDHAFWVILGVLPLLSSKRSLMIHKFWEEQAGTMIGFLVSAALVAIMGTDQAWYWLSLPLVVLISAYAHSAVSLVAGQAAFTVVAVFLFCILLPQQTGVGILRVEDVAIGGAVSLVVASLRSFGTARLRGRWGQDRNHRGPVPTLVAPVGAAPTPRASPPESGPHRMADVTIQCERRGERLRGRRSRSLAARCAPLRRSRAVWPPGRRAADRLVHVGRGQRGMHVTAATAPDRLAANLNGGLLCCLAAHWPGGRGVGCPGSPPQSSTPARKRCRAGRLSGTCCRPGAGRHARPERVAEPSLRL